ncbi:putative quinol monooxygenase [Paracoccus benzoatiresistens]|uniref:Quinol monooxygenase n=1 Tax=Paracoccus benzoatiresistens TaxID=2997341 RepID=A0ABT4JA31_9RHOB|nr:putative quinol monooxygenase [Paracoccus sp. EF6]MCZ0963946.1 putative quinol monooxygenase [Paracoccus sp. EF6]
MYAVTVTFTIAQDRMADFLPLMLENAQTSLAEEPGCHQFDVCTDPGLPDRVFLYELYDDRAAFETHLQSPHFRSFDAAVTAMFAEKSVACFAEVR